MSLREKMLTWTAGSLLGLGFLVAAGPSLAEVITAAGGMDAVSAAWRDSLASWAGETDEVKREKATSFFQGVSVADALKLCSAAPGDTLGEPAMAAGFLEAKMRLAPFRFVETIVLLNDDNLQAPCQKTLIKHISLMKDGLSRPEREMAAEALLKIADSDGQSIVVRNQLELAAAELSVSDGILRRMITYADSHGDDLRLQGFSMMIQSGDPRADEMLFERLRVMKEAGEFPPPRVLINLGSIKGRKAFDILARFYTAASGDEQLRGAVHGMAHSGDPRFMPVLLDLYADRDTGIRDATSELPDTGERGRYFDLWHMIRLMEPTVLEALNGRDRELSSLALELIDRQSRYGLPAHPAEMAEALRIARERGAGDLTLLERLDQIGARFEVHERAKFERGRLRPKGPDAQGQIRQ